MSAREEVMMLDAHGKPTDDPGEAASVRIVEYDEKGRRVRETYGFTPRFPGFEARGRPKTSPE